MEGAPDLSITRLKERDYSTETDALLVETGKLVSSDPSQLSAALERLVVLEKQTRQVSVIQVKILL